MKTFSELREKKDPCWKGYTQVGMKKKDGKEVPNCVPSDGVEKAKGYKKEDYTVVSRGPGFEMRKNTQTGKVTRVWVESTELGEAAKPSVYMKTMYDYDEDWASLELMKGNKVVASWDGWFSKTAKGNPLVDKFKEVAKKGKVKPEGLVFIDGETGKRGVFKNGDLNWGMKESVDLEEKAVSKAQQKFMGMVRAKQKGEMDDASPEVAKAAKSMSKKDVKDFASTKHKDLPAKKESVDEADSWMKDSGWRKAQKMRKDRYGNTVKDKNVAKHLAKSAQKKTAAMNKESVDKIDELSKNTLRRYDDANELDRERLSGKIGMVKGKMTPDQKKTLAKLQKRVKGADAVSRKLYPGAYKEAKDAAKDTYFNTYSAAVQHAKAQAEKQGYEVEEDDWFDQVTTGKGKPGNGKTTRHVLKLMKNGKPTRKGLAIQVYNRGSDKNPYELNFYVS